MPVIYKEFINSYEILHLNDSELWQKPVITEKQIFDNIYINKLLPYNYIAFPWASYIDNKWTKQYNETEKIIDDLINDKLLIDNSKTYFTVVQHIEFRNYIEKFKKLNIQYIFTPHKINSDYELENKYNISIIPISLFPKQNNKYNYCQQPKKKIYLVSFMGQIIHKNNISDIRNKMFECLKNKPNCFLKCNDKWFYEKHVYGNNNDKIKENNKLQENDEIYIKTINDSVFSLCPSGTGPNSIRLWESISFGSIPVILSNDLILPIINKDIDYRNYFVLWKEENIDTLYDYLLTIDNKTKKQMSKNCFRLYNDYFCELNMHKPILYYFSEKKI